MPAANKNDKRDELRQKTSVLVHRLDHPLHGMKQDT